MYRVEGVRNENSTNINPGKNQLNVNQAPKSAFKDLTNAAKSHNVLGGKAGPLFRTPQIQNKKESKVKEKEAAIHIYLDDFCTSLPKVSSKFPEMNWMSLDTDKLAQKFAKPMKSECLDYEVFKDDEFVLQPCSDPEPPKLFEDLDLSMGTDNFNVEVDDFVLQPMKIEDLPDLDFGDFNFGF